MKLQLNGKLQEVPESESLLDLLGVLHLPAKTVLIERNGHPVPRAEFATTWITEGDSVEIVQMVAGG
jgi:thiamine biosynthesis protein ThiS